MRRRASGFRPTGNTKGVQYIALWAQGWWKNTAAVHSDTEGCCWILSDLTTKGFTGQISLQFTASSNTSGPMYFQMEWAETDDAKTWTPIGNEYVASNWHSCIAAPEYLFVLPDELKDREVSRSVCGDAPAQRQRHGELRFGNQPHRCRTHVVPRFINRKNSER